jgi:hypothetical protein
LGRARGGALRLLMMDTRAQDIRISARSAQSNAAELLPSIVPRKIQGCRIDPGAK